MSWEFVELNCLATKKRRGRFKIISQFSVELIFWIVFVPSAFTGEGVVAAFFGQPSGVDAFFGHLGDLALGDFQFFGDGRGTLDPIVWN